MRTSSFFHYFGPGRVSIARMAPRGVHGFRVYKPLAPGPWFNSVSQTEYRRRYFAMLDKLEAALVWAELHALVAPAEPVLLCYERKRDIDAGTTYCHRHMVAEWFLRELGHVLVEINGGRHV